MDKPKFQVGDWVRVKATGQLVQVTGILAKGLNSLPMDTQEKKKDN